MELLVGRLWNTACWLAVAEWKGVLCVTHLGDDAPVGGAALVVPRLVVAGLLKNGGEGGHCWWGWVGSVDWRGLRRLLRRGVDVVDGV